MELLWLSLGYPSTVSPKEANTQEDIIMDIDYLRYAWKLIVSFDPEYPSRVNFAWNLKPYTIKVMLS